MSTAHTRQHPLLLLALVSLAAACSDPVRPPTPTSMVVISGDAQTGIVSERLALPIVIIARDAAGHGAAGVEVIWTVSDGGGMLSADSAPTVPPVQVLRTVTDRDGYSSAAWILGAQGGLNRATVSVGQVTPDTVTSMGRIAATSITAGWSYACALTSHGAAYCWGNESGGSVPHLVDDSLRFTQIAAGDRGACGLTAAGAAYCWGVNTDGQNGTGSTTPSTRPLPVSGGLTFAFIDASEFNTCGIAPNGDAYCWGENSGGQIGDSTTTTRLTPVLVHGGLKFTALSLAYRTICGLAIDQRVYCWGNTGSRVPALASAVPFQSVASGITHRCGIAVDNQAYCWGTNNNGELGNGTTNPASAPVPVSTTTPLTMLSTHWYHTCGLTATGAAYCWGRSSDGALGSGQLDDTLFVPTAVVAAAPYTAITTSTALTCALDSGGVAYCWGWNNLGALGDGGLSSRATPGRVALF